MPNIFCNEIRPRSFCCQLGLTFTSVTLALRPKLPHRRSFAGINVTCSLPFS